jgi:hypothetical protein
LRMIRRAHLAGQAHRVKCRELTAEGAASHGAITGSYRQYTD